MPKFSSGPVYIPYLQVHVDNVEIMEVLDSFEDLEDYVSCLQFREWLDCYHTKQLSSQCSARGEWQGRRRRRNEGEEGERGI